MSRSARPTTPTNRCLRGVDPRAVLTPGLAGIVYNLASAERFPSWVILAIEKKRNGVDKVDLEFQKVFAQDRFDPDGGRVEEELIDDRIFVE